MRATGAGSAVAVLTDWDFFFLGALSKLGALLRYGFSFNYSDNVLHSCNERYVSLHVSFYLNFPSQDLTCCQCHQEQAPSWESKHKTSQILS